MKFIREAFIVGIAVFILTNIISLYRSPELSSKQLPKIEVTLLDGSLYKVEEGKPLLIHFWATWCSTCKLEATNIESISKKYNVITVAVSSGTDEEIRDYIKKYNLSFPVINDSDGIWAKRFKVEVFPTTFIYNSSGELKFTEVGYTTTAGLLARLKWIQ